MPYRAKPPAVLEPRDVVGAALVPPASRIPERRRPLERVALAVSASRILDSSRSASPPADIPFRRGHLSPNSWPVSAADSTVSPHSSSRSFLIDRQVTRGTPRATRRQRAADCVDASVIRSRSPAPALRHHSAKPRQESKRQRFSRLPGQL